MDMRRSREGASLSGRNGMMQAQREERTALGREEWLVVSAPEPRCESSEFVMPFEKENLLPVAGENVRCGHAGQAGAQDNDIVAVGVLGCCSVHNSFFRLFCQQVAVGDGDSADNRPDNPDHSLIGPADIEIV